MKNRIGPTVKHVWNFSCIFLEVVINTTGYHLGKHKPSSTSTEELLVWILGSDDFGFGTNS